MAWCSECEKEGLRRAAGTSGLCKKHYARAYYQRSKKPKTEAKESMATVAKTAEALGDTRLVPVQSKAKPETPGKLPKSVTLDPGPEFRPVLQAVQKLANKELRTVPAQVIYMLRQSLEQIYKIQIA